MFANAVFRVLQFRGSGYRSCSDFRVGAQFEHPRQFSLEHPCILSTGSTSSSAGGRYLSAMRHAALCPADIPTTLIRNIAARGRLRTFVVRTDPAVGGTVVVRSGPFPFFIRAKRREHPLVDGLTIKRGFFDASFEVIVTASTDAHVRLD